MAAFSISSALAQNGRSLGFTQFELPKLDTARRAQVRDGSQYVQNATALGWAVLETNRLELQHRVDFAVITMDCGVFAPEPTEAAAEVARFAQGLTVRRLYLVSAPCLRSRQLLETYGRFVQALQNALSRHEVVDLTGKADRWNEFTLIGLNSAAMASSGADREMSRVEMELADGQTALLFAVLENTSKDGTLQAETLWKYKRWASLAALPNVAGFFVGVLSGVPQADPPLPFPNAKLSTSLVRVVPRLAPVAGGLPRGLLFARVARDGRVDAAPSWMPAPGEPIDLEHTLEKALRNERNGDYTDALAGYEEALKSKDVHVRATAFEGMRRTNDVLNTSWERWKSEVAAVRWIDRHWLTTSLLLSLLLAFLLYRWIAPGVRVDMATKLGADAPVELFMIHFLDSANVIHSIWASIPVAIAAKRGLDVQLSTEASLSVAKELEGVALPGVDVQSILKWLLFLWHYPAWRLEITVCGSAAQAVVYARLRFAWHTKRVYMQPTSTTGPMNVQTAARALMCDVIVDGVALR